MHYASLDAHLLFDTFVYLPCAYVSSLSYYLSVCLTVGQFLFFFVLLIPCPLNSHTSRSSSFSIFSGFAVTHAQQNGFQGL